MGPKVADRFRIAEIITMIDVRYAWRNFVYTIGNTAGVMAPPLNPWIAR